MHDTAIEDILALLVRYWTGHEPGDIEQRNLCREVGKRVLQLLPAPLAQEAQQQPAPHAAAIRSALLQMNQSPADRALLAQLTRHTTTPSTSVTVIGNENITFAGTFGIDGNVNIGTGASSGRPPRAAERTIDLAIITAMPEELDHVLNLVGGRQRWERKKLNNYTHYYAEFMASQRALSVIACSQGKYGGDETIAAVHRLAALRPRLIAMTGICAGREEAVHLGDVIVADRAFRAEEGKLTPQGLQPDTQTYQPPSWLMQALKDFSLDDQWHTTIMTPRPISLRYQAQWMLCRMASAAPAYPATEADWHELKTNGIAPIMAKQSLMSKGWISADGLIAPEGRTVLEELRWKHYGALEPDPDPNVPHVHYGAFASTVPVIATHEPFLEYKGRVRTVRAIDLEVRSLLSAAADLGVPAFAVKGVSDYGTPEKDDAFHEYAAEAAARWMYAFVTWNADITLDREI